MSKKNFRLSEIINLIGGGTPKRSMKEYWNGDIPWLVVSDFNNDSRYVESSNEKITQLGLENSSTKLLKPGMLIISARGTVGKLAQLNSEMAFSQSCYGIDAKTEFTNNDYLYYLLKMKINELQSLAHGSIFDTIIRSTFDNIFVDIPSHKEQEQVLSILSNLDEKIKNNEEQNKTLEQIAKTLFKSWFVDFDPVRAKVEKKPTGLSKEINDLFPDSFEDSELGKIPKNYKVGKLEELAKYLNRGVSPTYVENNGVYLVNQKCIRNGEIDFNLCKQSKEKLSMNERYLEKYDILLNSMGVGTLGRVAMFYEFDKKITADALVTIIKGESVGSSFFIYYFLERMEDYLNTISVGSTGQTSLKKEDILNLQMTIPPKNLLDEFGNQLSIFAEKKYLNNEENLILRDLRDALLPKLISGELKVSDAENLIEEVKIK